MISRNEVDPVAEALAEALPDLSHPSGQRVWLAGLAGDKLRRTRITCAEAIVAWFRKRSEDQDRCTLCGVGTGEVDRARQGSADGWEAADTAMNELRRANARIAELESALEDSV